MAYSMVCGKQLGLHHIRMSELVKLAWCSPLVPIAAKEDNGLRRMHAGATSLLCPLDLPS